MAEHRIAICGSMRFIAEMEALGRELSEAGWRVAIPRREESGLRWEDMSQQNRILAKKAYIDGHLAEIRGSTAVLIANYPKDGVDGYVGPNSLLEAAFAYALGIPVYFLFPIGAQACQLEAQAIASRTWGGRLQAINEPPA